MRSVTVCTDQCIWERYAILCMHNRRHTLQIDLVHDAVAWRNHIDVLEGFLGPVDKMKTVFVASVFNRPIFFKSIRIKATAFDGE